MTESGEFFVVETVDFVEGFVTPGGLLDVTVACAEQSLLELNAARDVLVGYEYAGIMIFHVLLNPPELVKIGNFYDIMIP